MDPQFSILKQIIQKAIKFIAIVIIIIASFANTAIAFNIQLIATILKNYSFCTYFFFVI